MNAANPHRHQPPTAQRLVGAAVWLALLSGLAAASWASLQHQPWRSVASSMARFWITRPPSVPLAAPAGLVLAETAVFQHDAASDRWRQVGVVQRVTPATAAAIPATTQQVPATTQEIVEVLWFEPHPPAASLHWQAHHSSGSMNETLALLLPEAKRRRLQMLVQQAMQEHGQTLADQFQPLLEQSLRRSLPLIERQLVASLRQHKPQIEAITDAWRRQWADETLPRLAQEQVWPIIQQHSGPLADNIGRELWNRASLWSFTWRAVYDRSPLPRKDLMRSEWERFAREEAVPVLEAHADEIATAMQAILADLAASPAIRSELGEAVDVLLDDPRTRPLVASVLRDTLVDNPPLHAAWTEVWTSEQAQTVLEQAGRRIEPLVRQIGEEILGSPQTGIDPGLARVIRAQILGKDKRWIVVHDTATAAAQTTAAPAVGPDPQPKSELGRRPKPRSQPEQLPRIEPAQQAAAYPLLPAQPAEWE